MTVKYDQNLSATHSPKICTNFLQEERTMMIIGINASLQTPVRNRKEEKLFQVPTTLIWVKLVVVGHYYQ